MPTKQIFDIDGRNFSTLEGFFDEINRVLLPSAPTHGWGRNLDSFNDILRGGFGTPEEGFVLRWKNSDVSKERLGYSETVRQLELRLRRCHPACDQSSIRDIDLAKSERGPTVFDWLVEVIKEHGPGGEESEDAVDLVLD